MIGLDTNVLARAILVDDAKWSPVSQRFLTENLTEAQPGYINLVTLAELVWTLRRSRQYDKERLAEVVAGLLAARNIVLERPDLVARALSAFQAGKPGFADCLIAELNVAAGVTHTVTIDGDASKTAHFVPLA